MFSIPKKLLSLFFVFMLTWFQLTTPALASTYSVDLGNGYSSTMVGDAVTYDDAQGSEEFLNKCLFSQPDKGVEEVACNVGKTIAVGIIIVGTCYAADAVATTIFPPAAALAPLCNVLGVAGVGTQAIKNE